jgi:hypothetical protein
MLKLSQSVIVVIVALATLVAPGAAPADPAPPPPPAKVVDAQLMIMMRMDAASPKLYEGVARQVATRERSS